MPNLTPVFPSVELIFADAVSGAVSARVAATAAVASAVVGILANEAALAGIGAFAGDNIAPFGFRILTTALGIDVDAAGASDRALAVAGSACTGAWVSATALGGAAGVGMTGALVTSACSAIDA